MQRRVFLKSSGMTLFAAMSGAVPAFLGRAAHAAADSLRGKVLVTIFQRFGMDGLMAVSPLGDARLAALRPNLVLTSPGAGNEDARVDLGNGFGLHPSFRPLLPMYRDGSLAIVHAVGSPHQTRAHAEAQMWWETGAPGERRVTDGWLNRAVGAAAIHNDAMLPAVALTSERPRILYGTSAIATIDSLDALSVQLPEAGSNDEPLAELRQLYARHGNERLRQAGTGGLDAARIIEEARRAARTNDDAAGYPRDSTFGRSLREIAQLIRAGVGLRVAFADSRFDSQGRSAWDSHSNQAAMNGPFAEVSRDFSQSLAAFWKDLGKHRDDVVVVTLTEFGRNVVENETLGTDHGRATAMFVLGNGVRGGEVYGSLPERFDRDALDAGADLPVTTDFRSVLSAVTAQQLGITSDAVTFPGWNGTRLRLLRG